MARGQSEPSGTSSIVIPAGSLHYIETQRSHISAIAKGHLEIYTVYIIGHTQASVLLLMLSSNAVYVYVNIYQADSGDHNLYFFFVSVIFIQYVVLSGLTEREHPLIEIFNLIS